MRKLYTNIWAVVFGLHGSHITVLIMNNPHHTAAFSKANILQIMDAVIPLSETHNKSQFGRMKQCVSEV